MEKKTKQTIKFKVRRIANSRKMRMTIKSIDSGTITVPKKVSKEMINKFIKDNQAWIQKQIIAFRKRPVDKLSKLTKDDYKKHKEEARKIITERVEHFNKQLKYTYNKIAIRDQQTRWGSCTTRGNLNFNYKIIFWPDDLRDYVIVHELCHLMEMNHSKDFWKLVESVIPNYKEIMKRIKNKIY